MAGRFSRRDLAALLAVAGIVAVLAVPTLARSRAASRTSRSRANLHIIGIGLAILSEGNRGMYPGWVTDAAARKAHDGVYLRGDTIEPQPWVEAKGGPMFQLYAGDCVPDLWMFDSPSVRFLGVDEQRPQVWEKGMICPYSNTDMCMTGCEYAYDVGRIHSKSNPARITMSDLLNSKIDYADGAGRVLIHFQDRGALGGAGGLNVLFFDLAVAWAPKEHPNVEWRRDQLGTTQAAAPSFGYLPNPRLDEDAHYDPANEAFEGDIDDIFSVECDSSRRPFNQMGRFTFKAVGYIPSPRLDEDALLERDNQALTDVDDIYSIECDSGYGWLEWDGTRPGEVPGVLCPVSYERGGPADPEFTPWRTHINDGAVHDSGRRKFIYEQRGPYA